MLGPSSEKGSKSIKDFMKVESKNPIKIQAEVLASPFSSKVEAGRLFHLLTVP